MTLNVRKGTKLQALTDLYGIKGEKIAIRKGAVVTAHRVFTEDSITWLEIEPRGRLYHLNKFEIHKEESWKLY